MEWAKRSSATFPLPRVSRTHKLSGWPTLSSIHPLLSSHWKWSLHVIKHPVTVTRPEVTTSKTWASFQLVGFIPLCTLNVYILIGNVSRKYLRSQRAAEWKCLKKVVLAERNVFTLNLRQTCWQPFHIKFCLLDCSQSVYSTCFAWLTVRRNW